MTNNNIQLFCKSLEMASSKPFYEIYEAMDFYLRDITKNTLFIMC